MPFSTNAPIYVGSELVTPSTIGSGCIASSLPPGSCVLTATFSQAHGRGEIVRSGTYGLQEALNDAGASGGGAVTTDSAWSSIGGISAMISAATKPANTAVEDVRTGAASGTFTALTQDATSTSSGGTTEVVGLLTHPLPSLSTGFLNWSGTAWAFSAAGGTPGGTTGQTQYNNGGAFGGYTMGGDCTITASTGVIVCTKSNGTAFGTAAFIPTPTAASIYALFGCAGVATTFLNGAGGCTTPAGAGTVTSFAAPSASWPSWLVPTVATATTTPSLSVAASAIPYTAFTALTQIGARCLNSYDSQRLSQPSCSGASNALI